MRSSITEVDGAAPAHPRSRLPSAVKGTVAADGGLDRSFATRLSNEDFNIFSFCQKLHSCFDLSSAYTPRTGVGVGVGGVIFQPEYFFELCKNNNV
jgi:hypothetical protein